ncbi:MAG: hypothetical protein ACPGPE_04695 [Planctomycetota bacterium]
MPRKRHAQEEIIHRLREAEAVPIVIRAPVADPRTGDFDVAEAGLDRPRRGVAVANDVSMPVPVTCAQVGGDVGRDLFLDRGLQELPRGPMEHVLQRVLGRLPLVDLVARSSVCHVAYPSPALGACGEK